MKCLSNIKPIIKDGKEYYSVYDVVDYLSEIGITVNRVALQQMLSRKNIEPEFYKKRRVYYDIDVLSPIIEHYIKKSKKGQK